MCCTLSPASQKHHSCGCCSGNTAKSSPGTLQLHRAPSLQQPWQKGEIPCYVWSPVSRHCNIQGNNKKICSSATEALSPLTWLSIPAGFSRVWLQYVCFPLGKNTTTNTFSCLTLHLAGLQIVNKQDKNLRMFFTESPWKETEGKKKLKKQTQTLTLHDDECTKRNLACTPSHPASSATFSAI